MELLRIVRLPGGRYRLEIVTATTVGEVLAALQAAQAQITGLTLAPAEEGDEGDERTDSGSGA